MKLKKDNKWRLPIIVVILMTYLSPFYILLGIAFKPESDLSSLWSMPKAATMENFNVAVSKGSILQALGNSLLITFTVVILTILIASLAAYPLSRIKTKTNRLIKAFILGIMMVPPLTILVPLYSLLVKIGAINQFWGIIITLLTFELPMAIVLYMNFISSIPTALDESAMIDGAGPVRTFYTVIFPQLKSVTVSVAILTGLHCWNDYQFSLYILQSPKVKTVTLAIQSFFSQTTSNLNAAAAAAVVGILPIVVCFLLLQKYFVKGMVDSAIK